MVAAELVLAALSVASAPQVVDIQPSAATLPATTLRLYITFNRPARGWFRQSEVKLLADGKPVRPSPFMDFGQELWSPDGRRLTLLFDPGRIKRDVAGRGAEAAPLQPGLRYRIEAGDKRHTFAVGPALRLALNPTLWQITRPQQRLGPVTLKFDRIMDFALASHQLVVERADGKYVEGQSSLDSTGKVWRFTPQTEWQTGSYRVVVGPTLEDISGNRIGEALDHDAGQPDILPPLSTLPFDVVNTIFAHPSSSRNTRK